MLENFLLKEYQNSTDWFPKVCLFIAIQFVRKAQAHRDKFVFQWDSSLITEVAGSFIDYLKKGGRTKIRYSGPSGLGQKFIEKQTHVGKLQQEVISLTEELKAAKQRGCA